jgi:hypothetical protein
MPLLPIKRTAFADFPEIPGKPSNQASSTSPCGASLNLPVVEIPDTRITLRAHARFCTFFFWHIDARSCACMRIAMLSARKRLISSLK